MSEKTYEQDKMLTISSALQKGIPLFIFYIPVLLRIAYGLLDETYDSTTIHGPFMNFSRIRKIIKS